MRQIIIAALAAILAACGQQKGFAEESEERVAEVRYGRVTVAHDATRGVTCYVVHQNGSGPKGISCIPDSQLQQAAP